MKNEKCEIKQKIAVVGGGMAGLAAGWLFGRAGCQVVLFEKLPRLAFEAHCLEWPHGEGPGNLGDQGTYRAGVGGIDVPLRLFNRQQWPQVCQLYHQAGVATTEVDTSQSFSEINAGCYFQVDRQSLFTAARLAWWRSATRRIWRDAARLKSEGQQVLSQIASDSRGSLKEHLLTRQYSPDFVNGFLYPVLSSTVCTCSYQTLDNYPVDLLLTVLNNLSGGRAQNAEPMMRTRYGSPDVVQKLVAPIARVRVDTEVVSILPSSKNTGIDGIQIGVRNQLGKIEEESFDDVVVATTSRAARRLLSPSSAAELAMLECFLEEPVVVVVHRDRRLMPPRRRQWRTFNFITDRSHDESTAAMCSVWLNRFLSLPSTCADVFQTINPIVEPHSDLSFCRIELARAVVDAKCRRGWSQLEQLHSEPDRRIWFAGSYAVSGVPLLETAVISSRQVFESVTSRSPATFPV